MFSCTPSVFLNEGAEVIRLMHIYHRGTAQNEQQQQQQQPQEGGEYD